VGVIKEGATVIVEDAETDSRWAPLDRMRCSKRGVHRVRTVIGVPIWLDTPLEGAAALRARSEVQSTKELVGVLVAINKHAVCGGTVVACKGGLAFNDNDRRLLEGIVEQVRGGAWVNVCTRHSSLSLFGRSTPLSQLGPAIKIAARQSAIAGKQAVCVASIVRTSNILTAMRAVHAARPDHAAMWAAVEAQAAKLCKCAGGNFMLRGGANGRLIARERATEWREQMVRRAGDIDVTGSAWLRQTVERRGGGSRCEGLGARD